jgi:hypothetical protein
LWEFCAAFGISLKKFDGILERRLPRDQH